MPLKTAGSANTIGLLTVGSAAVQVTVFFVGTSFKCHRISQFLSAKGGAMMWAACPGFLF